MLSYRMTTTSQTRTGWTSIVRLKWQSAHMRWTLLTVSSEQPLLKKLFNLVQVYEDTLAAQKAAFESFVTITDPVESEKLSLYKSLLPEMEQATLFLWMIYVWQPQYWIRYFLRMITLLCLKNLPIPDEMKSSRGSESPIRVVDLVFSAGESRK